MAPKSSRIALLGIFLVGFVLIKYLAASRSVAPDVFYDELIYKANAEKIFHLEPLSSTHYPPLYSILLSSAFISTQYWHNVILFINVIVSSLVLIPGWFISVRFLPKSLSFMVLMLMCLSSFQIYYPQLIMSENLYVPLFLFSILILLSISNQNKGKLNLFFNFLFGVSLALGYLTRYIHLVAIPMLMILWLIKPHFDEDPSRRAIFEKFRFFDFLAISSGFMLCYAPWLIYLHYSEVPVAQGMGSEFVRNGIRDFATFRSLILWASFYGAYMILAMAPYLLAFSLYAFMCLKRQLEIDRDDIFFILVVALVSVGFLMAATQHSWRAGYNYPVPRTVMGRYLMHLSPLYLIAFMIALNRIRDAAHRLSLSQIAFSSVLCLISILLALGMLFIIQDARGLKYSFLNGPYGVMFGNRVFTSLFLAVFVFCTGLLIIGRRSSFLPKLLISLFCVPLFALQLGTSYKALEATLHSRKHYQLHARPLSQFLAKEMEMGNESVTIVKADPELRTELFSLAIKFWLLSPMNDVNIELKTLKEYFSGDTKESDRTYFLTSDYWGEPLYHYTVRGRDYYIYDFRPLFQEMLFEGNEGRHELQIFPVS